MLYCANKKKICEVDQVTPFPRVILAKRESLYIKWLQQGIGGTCCQMQYRSRRDLALTILLHLFFSSIKTSDCIGHVELGLRKEPDM